MSMKMRELEVIIGRGLESRLDDFKYFRSKGLLRKNTATGWQAIMFNPLRASAPGFAKLAAFGHVRIDAVETIYTSHHSYLVLNPKRAAEHSTIAFNCDSLIRDDSLIHSFPTDPVTVEDFMDRYVVALQVKVFPVLDRYSSESELFEGLSCLDSAKRVVPTGLGRFPALLAMLVRRGDWDSFEIAAQEFLQWCTGSQAQVHRPFAEAMISGLRSERGGSRDGEAIV